MFTVVASYRQNVHAYPSGGGDYEVATTNLGPKAGLTVASALLVDYVLTVAVSIASGIENLGSAIPFVVEHKVLCAVAVIVLLTLMNLRGVKESGKLFADPDVRLRRRRLHHDRLGAFRGLVSGDTMKRRPPTTRSRPSTRAWPASPSSSCSRPSPPAVRRSTIGFGFTMVTTRSITFGRRFIGPGWLRCTGRSRTFSNGKACGSSRFHTRSGFLIGTSRKAPPAGIRSCRNRERRNRPLPTHGAFHDSKGASNPTRPAAAEPTWQLSAGDYCFGPDGDGF